MKYFSFILLITMLAGTAVVLPARADSYLPQIGGPGGAQYRERCPQGQVLNGFELRAGDDIDAIRAVCVTPYSATDISPPPLSNGRGAGWHGGGGGSLQRLLCPPETPAVMGLAAGYDGIDTISLDAIDIYCGQASASASIGQYPSNMLHAPVQGCTDGPNLLTYEPLKNAVFGDGRCPNFKVGRFDCPAGEIAIGMHGHSGAKVDAMGLICGPAPVFRPSVPAMGHTDTKPELTPVQKALRGAKVVGRVRPSVGSAGALNPQPLPPGHSANDFDKNAIIIVGGKQAAPGSQSSLNPQTLPPGHTLEALGSSAIILSAGKGQPPAVEKPPVGSGTDWLYAVDAKGHLWKFKQAGHALSKAKRENGDWSGFVSVIVSGAAGSDLVVYGLQANGDLIWRRIGGIASGIDTAAAPLRQAEKPVGNGWNSFKHVFSTGEGVVYGVAANDDLVWYRQKNKDTGNAAPQWVSHVVGTGWGSFTRLFSPGHGVIYAMKADGTLLWYRHHGYLSGAGLNQPGAWEGPKTVGSGWQHFKQVFAAGNGHIYAVNAAGELLYYNHRGWQTGSTNWDAPVKLGGGWGGYVHVFAALGQ